MAEDSNDPYGRAIDSWLQGTGGRVILGVLAALVLWGAFVVLG